MKYLLILIMQLIDLFYPKKKDRVLIGSSNGRNIVGNSKVFGEYLESKGYEVYYIWNNPPKGKTNICPTKIKDWPIFLSGKTVVTTHSASDLGKWQKILRRRRTYIELWHGIPLKAMGQLMPSADKRSRRYQLSLLKRNQLWSVSSELFKHLFLSMYPLDKDVFQVLGSPRNDQYHKQKTELGNYLKDLPIYEKVILYVPTRREDDTEALFFPFPERDVEKIIQYIEEHKILILLRRHIDDKHTNKVNSPYIRTFNSEDVADIDSVLGLFDSIVTDYSSIYFDFLFFDRTIAFLPYDLDDYIRNRGLLFDYDAMTPGVKIDDSNGFIQFLSDLINGIDNYQEHRQIVFKMAYTYQDNHACDRIFDYLTKNGLLIK